MRPCLVLAAILPFAAMLPAQQDPASAPKPASAEARMKAINDKQQQLFEAWEKQVDAAQKAAEKAKADGKPLPAVSMSPDFSPLVADALAAAKDFAGTDDAVDFLVMAIQMSAIQMSSGKAVRRESLQTLIDRHLDSARLAQLGRMLPYLDELVDKAFAEQAMPALLRSKNADVRGWALLAKHKDVIDNGDRSLPAYVDARAKLMAAADEVTDKDLAKEIRSTIETREKYGVGVQAPDIEGQDLDGVAFKLSDYKGKIVFLDFWGDW